MKKTGENFENLVGIMRKLRKKGGCPWDRKQTFMSLRQYVIEEAYEVIDAIEMKKWEDLRDELGDLLMQVLFLSRLAQEAGKFTINDVINSITEKMVRRHPHVFGNESLRTPDDVLRKWAKIKQAEGRKRLLGGIPQNLPSLLQAFRLGQKAAHVGFDWRRPEDVMEKVEEELQELKSDIKAARKAGIRRELGDLLFSLANLSRKSGFNPEFLLRKTNRIFIKRFNYIERALTKQKKELSQAGFDELNSLWESAKKRFP